LFNSKAAPRPPVSLKLNPLLYNQQQRPWSNIGSSGTQQRLKLMPMNRNNFNSNQQRYIQSNQYLPPSASFNSMRRRTRSAVDNDNNHDNDDNNELDDNWEHFDAHRERRDLYERIANASPM
jgi:hypothetical protein